MLSKCANPACSAPFRYLREGKLFEMQTQDPVVSIAGPKPPRRVEFFWLCDHCSTELTVVLDQKTGVKTVPLPKAAARRAAAS